MTEYMWIGYDTIVTTTDDAILFDMGEDEPTWIPSSLIEDIDVINNSVSVHEWWLVQEELV